MKLAKAIATALVLLAAMSLPARARPDIVGDWHGLLKTPVGELALIVTILEEDGVLSAQLESPNQAPGRKIPITGIEATDDHLAFSIQPISASYEGKWVEAEQHWSGHWQQGGKAPLVFEREAPAASAVLEGLDGTWEGAVQRNGVDLRLILRAKTGEAGTQATLDSPDLGAFGLPVAGLFREADHVRFTVPASGVRFEGTLDEEGTRLTGSWTLPGRPVVQVTFARTSDSALRSERVRPQTPSGPFDYRVEDAAFGNPEADGVTLSGTLTLPRGAGPFPAAVLVSGSGPQDRDGTIDSHKPFAVLADHLTRSGVAVLRYDDRGFGESTGDHMAATSADFATDARAAARFLRSRSDIDRGGIGFIGHSEGGMIAPIAAAGNDEIAFLVLLAGPGTSTLQLMRSQNLLLGLSQGRSEEELARAAPIVERISSAVANAPGREDARQRVSDLLTPEAMALLSYRSLGKEVLVEGYTRNWFRYFLQYDPAEFLARLDQPVLALNGSLDRQVPADENLAAIEKALEDNPDATTRKLDGLNHMFQTAETGALGEYGDIRETFSPAALRIVSDWIEARFGAGAAMRTAAR